MTFSAELKEVINIIGEKLGIAIDWTQENVVPWLTDVLHRFTTLNIIENIIGLSIFFIIFALSIITAILCYKKYNEVATQQKRNSLWKYNQKGVDTTLFVDFLIVGSVIGIIAGFIGSICNEMSLLKWTIIPEIQIVKGLTYYISEL